MANQVMAYRNGGGIPSLATVPMNTSIGGEPHQLSYITPFEAEMLRGMGGSGAPGPGGIPQYAGVYEKIFGKPFSQTAVGQALGMNKPPPSHPENRATASLNSVSNTMLADAALPPSQRSKQSLGRRIKEQRRQEAAAAEQEVAANTATSGAVGADNPDVANQTIINMVNNRDDLTAAEKLEFAQSLGVNLGVPDGSGVQSAIDNLSNIALDPTSGMSDADRVSALTTLSETTGTDYSGLIGDLNNKIANVSTPGAPSVGGSGIVTTVTSPGANVASPKNFTNTSMAAVPDFTGYAPIVPSVASADGIMGLDSGQGSPFVYTAYMPEAYTPAVGTLALPPLG